jgi:uncharacterized membrane protein
MDNSVIILVRLVRLLRIPITSASIKQGLKEHPDFPSLLSISDVLSDWGIANAAYEVGGGDLNKIPVPFIAHLFDGRFALVKNVDQESVIVINKKGKEQKVDIEEFAETYLGNVLIVEPKAGSGDPDYFKSRIKEILHNSRIPFVLTGTLILFACLLLSNSAFWINLNWQRGLLSITKSAGLVTSILLLIQSVDSNNLFLRQLCSGTKMNCNAILSSKAARILWGQVSWSEVGFFYFAGSLLLFFSNNGSMAVNQALAALSILALPYTVYSIYYQGFVIKQWCILCCAVLVILWGEFCILAPYLFEPFHVLRGVEWNNFLICFLSPLILWVFIRPYLLRSQQVNLLEDQLRTLKGNEELFHKLLTGQEKYSLLQEADSMISGNSESEYSITFITSLSCSHCIKAHQTLQEWLAKGYNFRLQIVFAIDKQGKDIVQHIISLNASQDKSIAIKALSDWYKLKKKDYRSWATSYPVPITDGIGEILAKQEEWCKSVNLEYTPTILLNGYKLPKPYQLDDIKYFLFNSN